MTTVDVDGANTTAIQYDSYGSDTWSLTETSGNGAVFAQTLTRLQSTGGAVFHFHGTSVQVFGTVLSPRISGESVTSTYTIDGSGTTPYSSAQILQSITTSEADGLQFFDSGTLSDGDHVLVINVTSATSSDPYYLDYIQYVQTSATTTSSSASSTSSTTTTSSATSPPSNSGGSKPHIGAIVGGVVGGVCFLAVVALGIFLFLRYFRHRIGLSGRKRGGRDLVEHLAEEEEPKSDLSGPWSGNGSGVTPSLSGPALSHAPSDAQYAASTIVPDDSASQVAGRLYAAELAQQRLAALRAQEHGAEPSGSAAEAGAAPAWARDRKEPIPPTVPEEQEPEEAVQHQDSGFRFRDGELPPGVLPVGLHGAPSQEDAERPPEYGAGS